MSMSDVRKAINEGCAEKAQCTDVRMVYLGAGKGHELALEMVVNSKIEVVTCHVPKGQKPETVAQAWACKYVSGIKDDKK